MLNQRLGTKRVADEPDAVGRGAIIAPARPAFPLALAIAAACAAHPNRTCRCPRSPPSCTTRPHPSIRSTTEEPGD